MGKIIFRNRDYLYKNYRFFRESCKGYLETKLIEVGLLANFEENPLPDKNGSLEG